MDNATQATLTPWQQRKANSARGVTVAAGDALWSPVHQQALYVVGLTQTAAYVVALPDQPAGAERKSGLLPGDPRKRAVSKFVEGEKWPWHELTVGNQQFIEKFATLVRQVSASGRTQPLPGQPAPEEAPEGQDDMAKKAKAAKAPKAPKAPKEKKGPRLFWLTKKEAKEEDFARGGGLYGNAGNVYRAARTACNALESGKASSLQIANRLEKNEKNESATDTLLLTRAYLSKVVAAGFMECEKRGA